jgi:hypothetical protein
MSKRAIHLYPWDGGTEADQDMPDHVYCGAGGDMTNDQLTNDWRHVTCKLRSPAQCCASCLWQYPTLLCWRPLIAMEATKNGSLEGADNHHHCNDQC